MGVPLGSILSTKLSKRYPRSDPVICAVGLLLSAPLIAASMIFVTYSAPLAYLCVFLGELALNLNWAIVADMLLVRINFQTFCCIISFMVYPWVLSYLFYDNSKDLSIKIYFDKLTIRADKDISYQKYLVSSLCLTLKFFRLQTEAIIFYTST